MPGSTSPATHQKKVNSFAIENEYAIFGAIMSNLVLFDYRREDGSCYIDPDIAGIGVCSVNDED